jgi:CRP/FNR family transcriptional regulator
MEVAVPVVTREEASAASRKPAEHIPNCVTCKTRHLSVCAALSSPELVMFDQLVQHREYPPKSVLFEQGAAAGFVFSVSEGTIRLVRLLSDGRRQIVGFAIKGDFLGVGLESQYEFTAEAVDTARVCRIPHHGFEVMADEKPHLLRKLHEIASRELHHSHDQMVLLGRKNAEERVAAFLISHRDRLARVSSCTVTIPLPMSRSDIADYLGLTIETVSRTISKLAREKLIVVVPDGVRLLDPDRIAALAKG